MCHAVAFAHSHHYLHRDLKGQNVVLGDFHEVFVVDWGLAKKLSDPEHIAGPDLPSPDSDPPTRPGVVVGTPAYMAPEVAAKQPATVASDVYGLGAVLYQILTDRPPTAATTADEALSKLTSGAPIPSPRTYNPAVSAALEAVCRKALARTPADRYATATALADDVRRWLADEPVTAYREPWPTRAARWARRHRTGVTAAAVALVLTAVGSAVAAGLIWQEKERTADAKRKADDAKAEAETERDKYHAMLDAVRDYSDSLTDMVTETETGQAAGQSTVADRKARLERAVTAAQNLVAAQPDDPELQARLARLLRYTGNLARLRNDSATAVKSLIASVGIQQGLVGSTPDHLNRQLELIRTLEDEASVRAMFGDLAAAAPRLTEAVDRLAALPPAARDGPEGRRATGLVRLAQTYIGKQLGQFGPAEAAGEEAAKLFAGLRAAGPHDRLFHGIALQHLAAVRRERVRFEGGEYGPALQTAAAAEAVLRQLAQTDAGPDPRHNHGLAVVELARCRLLANAAPAASLAGLDRAVTGWRELSRLDPGLPRYRESLAVGLTVRAAVRLAVADEPAIRGAAAADLHEAIRLLGPLATAAPDRPAYRSELAEAWERLARIRQHPNDVQEAFSFAGAAAERAIRRGPGNKLYERDKADLTAAAERVGCDLRPPVLPPAKR